MNGDVGIDPSVLLKEEAKSLFRVPPSSYIKRRLSRYTDALSPRYVRTQQQLENKEEERKREYRRLYSKRKSKNSAADFHIWNQKRIEEANRKRVKKSTDICLIRACGKFSLLESDRRYCQTHFKLMLDARKQLDDKWKKRTEAQKEAQQQLDDNLQESGVRSTPPTRKRGIRGLAVDTSSAGRGIRGIIVDTNVAL